jgi:hypothetical protein
MRADKQGFWFLGPHKYGRYLHILKAAESEDHYGLQPWEGITGRVKQETTRLMAEIQRSNATMNSHADANHAAMNARVDVNQEAIKGVEASLKAQLGDVQRKLDGQQIMLERIEKVLSANVVG